MTYAQFIEEIRRLADQGDGFLGTPGTNESQPFRDWRHEAQSTVSNALDLGFRLPGKFTSSIKPYRANWIGCTPADNRKAFNRDMADSVTELRYLIALFDKYGPPETPPKARQPTAPLTAPEKVTVRWLIDNVPVKVWFILAVSLLTTFLVGVAAGHSEPTRALIADIEALLKWSSPSAH